MIQSTTSGPLTILIPGTKWGHSGGWGNDNPLFGYGKSISGQNSMRHRTILLKWSGGNNDRCRFEAAEMLRALIEQHEFAEDDKLSILTHSHGGNVALAASHRGLARRIDTLIALNKPMLLGEAYRPGPNLGNFFNIYAHRDWTQWAGSDAKFTGRWATDSNAVNLKVDTSSSDLKPHGAIIWDDKIREGWWTWVRGQILG